MRLQRLRSYDESCDFLTQHSQQSLIERLSLIKRRFSKIIVLGMGTDSIESILSTHDHSQEGLTNIPSFPHDYLSTTVATEEYLPFQKESVDLIITNLHLHWVNDLPGMLWQIRHILRPDGLFLAGLLGGNTLSELKASFLQAEMELYGGASARVVPMIELYTASQLLLRADFRLPVVDREVLTVTYPGLISLMQDLRKIGQTNVMHARYKGLTSRRLLKRTEEIYREVYGLPDDRLPATFEIIYLTGWAPHESQQKALPPGSAKLSLASVLEEK